MKSSTVQVVFNSLMRLIQVLLGFAGWAGAGLILGLHLYSELQPFLSMVLASGLGVIALVVHEGGHYLGARLHRMPTLPSCPKQACLNPWSLSATAWVPC